MTTGAEVCDQIGKHLTEILKFAEYNEDMDSYLVPQRDMHRLQQYVRGLTGGKVIIGGGLRPQCNTSTGTSATKEVPHES